MHSIENCHEYRAQRRFKRWRNAVDDTESLQRNNTVSAESLIRLIGSAATAVGAEVYRDSMLRALVREETPRTEADEGK